LNTLYRFLRPIKGHLPIRDPSTSTDVKLILGLFQIYYV
jgi:hypothetical protein